MAAKTQRKSSKVPGKPFVKGDPRICHDAAAKSKGKQFQARLAAFLEVEDAEGSSVNDRFVQYLDDIASAGNKQSVDAIKLLWDRAYGKSPQPVTDAEGNAVAPLYIRLDASMESRLTDARGSS